MQHLYNLKGLYFKTVFISQKNNISTILRQQYGIYGRGAIVASLECKKKQNGGNQQ